MNKTPLKGHKRKGKRLEPPFVAYGFSGNQSWLNDRLPEMIWAALLFKGLERSKAFYLLREMALKVGNLPKPSLYCDITLSGLANFEEEIFDQLIGQIAQDVDAKNCLSALLILEGLPGKPRWERALIGHESSLPRQVAALTEAVLHTLDHQAETATDCRWLRLICQIRGGLLHFPQDAEEELLNIFEFPNRGDLRSVRPSIRASEMMIDTGLGIKREWPKLFWEEIWIKTECIYPPDESSDSPAFSELSTTQDLVRNVYAKLCGHALVNFKTTGIEPRIETIFGMTLYAMTVGDEILNNPTQTFGRIGLRVISEIFITLKYLLKSNDDLVWTKYREFGSGQAKLADLKLAERNVRPAFLNIKKLEQIANEDKWEEFVAVNIGHWKGKDLRTLAIEADVKEIYDTYFEWSSSYVHAHWGALREHCYVMCLNPLHRGHRIPSLPPQSLPDSTPDVAFLLDKIIDLLANEYPVFPWRVGVFHLNDCCPDSKL